MSRPNVLIIHTDQLSWWTLGCYGGTVVDTPNIDRLAREGALFSNFFTNSAVCTPSRGCLVTGRYPHFHGAYRNNIPLNSDEITFAHVVGKHGYRTSYVGKWHLDGLRRPGWVHEDRGMGFDDNRYMFNRGHWQKIEDTPMRDAQPTVFPYGVIGDSRSYCTDWLTDKTMGILGDSESGPFCHMLSIPDPHGPVEVRAPYNTMFDPDQMPLPATFNGEDLPDWAEEARNRSRLSPDSPNREKWLRKFLASYFGEVKLIDDSVGRILDLLEQRKILDKTIVVFTADHGEYAGEHDLMGKNNLYETAHRVPMLVRWPEKITAGTVIESVVSTVDFQPTILGLLDLPASGREQGRDASPLLRGQQIPWQDEAFIHHSSFERAGIFTDKYQLAYVKNADPILFDRRNDPDQVHNLFSDPGSQDIIRSLTARIVEHNRDVGSPAVDWLEQVESQHAGAS